jgi:SnoaL-like domain
VSTVDLTILERELRQLSDRQTITDLISRLGLWLDEKRFDEAPDIFTPDVAVKTAGGSASGIDHVVEQARRNHRATTQHLITNVLIELDRDRADVDANLIVTFVPNPEQPDSRFALGERYRFEAVRTGSGWRLSRVEAAPVWSTRDLSRITERIAEANHGSVER